jgi:hypothetical protein
MTLALIDMPACLSPATTYVGPPRSSTVNGKRRFFTSAADDTAAFRRRAVRECFGTAAMLRAYREPLDGESWLRPADSERRLLAQINAIVALGEDALNAVCERAIDPDVPDPGGVFAALMILGSVDDDAFAARALGVFERAVSRGAGERRAAVEGLSLAPHPSFDASLAPFLHSDEATMREAALRVLSFRGALPEADWRDALRDPDLAVRAAALAAPLHGYDRDACERALSPFLDRRQAESLARLALRAGVGVDACAAHDFARRLCRDGEPAWADAALHLAMFGRASDMPVFVALLDGGSVELAATAASTFGYVELVPHLMRHVETRGAIGNIIGDARDLSRFHRATRYREGRALTPALLLELLERPMPGAREFRENLYLELRLATRSRVPRFSAYDFVAVQRAALSLARRA